MLSLALGVATCGYRVSILGMSLMPRPICMMCQLTCGSCAVMRSCQDAASMYAALHASVPLYWTPWAGLAAPAPSLQPLAQPPAEVTAWLGVARKAIWSALWQPFLDFRSEWQVWPFSMKCIGTTLQGVPEAVRWPPTASCCFAVQWLQVVANRGSSGPTPVAACCHPLLWEWPS